jgi:hypothetical protein
MGLDIHHQPLPVNGAIPIGLDDDCNNSLNRFAIMDSPGKSGIAGFPTTLPTFGMQKHPEA